MAKVPIQDKVTFKVRLANFIKTQLSFSALWYYQSCIFMTAFFVCAVIAVWPPFNLGEFVTFGLLFLLLCELTYYRYMNWKPERSDAFAIGAKMVVNVVHDEGILKYNRDGQEYALYSNKVAPKNSAK